MNIKTQVECRICGGELSDVLDLGTIYHSSFVPEDYIPDESEKAPLVLSECKSCGLVQLRDTVDLDVMYKQQYWYSSSLNKSMISSLKDVITDIESKIKLQDGDTVVDIGCNDGTLLNLYTERGLYKIGYDPAPNLKPSPSVYFVNDYFASDGYFDVYGQLKAKVVTAIAMFYDLPDPNKFVEQVKSILRDDGIFVVQFTDLLSMFKVCAFDNICHEHLEYYRLKDVAKLLRSHGLDVIDVSYNDVNGGSIRIVACHKGAYLPSTSVVTAMTGEREFFSKNNFDTFYGCIVETMLNTKAFLLECRDSGKKTLLLGASTKGNTLLQVCGITNKDVPYAAEVNKDKFGLVTLGSNIKIISEEEAFSMNPDFFFVPVWHFKNNLLTKKAIRDYISAGGKLVFPLPEFHIVGKEDLKNE